MKFTLLVAKGHEWDHRISVVLVSAVTFSTEKVADF